MTVVLWAIAAACLLLVVWSGPGVVRRHRFDRELRKAMEQLVAEWRRVVLELTPLFEAIGEAAAELGSLLSSLLEVPADGVKVDAPNTR